MSNIYLIENDGYDFKWLRLETHDIIDLMPEEYSLKQIHRFSLHNLSLGEYWKDVSTTFKPNFDRIDDPIPDVSLWLGHASLVLSEKAFDTLGDLLKDFGEFLPIDCNGTTFYIFNCRVLANADESKSKQVIFNGEVVGIEKIVFDESETIGKLIFKSKYNSCVNLFCGDAVKNAVEKHALKGIVFSSDLVPSFE